jgi:hypothetical protein
MNLIKSEVIDKEWHCRGCYYQQNSVGGCPADFTCVNGFIYLEYPVDREEDCELD